MTPVIEGNKRLQLSNYFNAVFFSRLGGIAGILCVFLALMQGLAILSPYPTLEKILQAVPNLAVVVWFGGVYAHQRSHLGRLGSLGAAAAMIGLTAITLINLINSHEITDAENWLGLLLASPALPTILTILAVSFVWGVLALGTTSLRANLLPKGAVVLWMVGLMSILRSQWPPIALVSFSGVIWSSIILLRGVPLKDTNAIGSGSLPEHAASPKKPGTERFIPLDALRGTIMILMAIDHASFFIRRWHPFETWDQPLPVYPNLAALLTRLVTHPCAPGFFFLMGAGMVLFAHARRQSGWSEGKIAGNLALRGFLLITLEQLIVDVASAGQINPFEFSILFGLGMAMIFGVFFLRLNGSLQAVTGTAVLVLMQFLPGFLLNSDLGIFSPVRLLILPGSVGKVFVLYPPIPWLGVVLVGMAFARLLLNGQGKAYRIAGISGLVCLVLFLFIRLLGGFGNLRPPPGDSLIDFFNLVKYPPSLSFLFLSLGFDLVALYLFSKISSQLATWARPVVVFGQTALYFFLAHWFVYGTLGLVQNTPGGLPQTYLAWIVGLILLYPVCRTYESFKHSMPPKSVWRLL